MNAGRMGAYIRIALIRANHDGAGFCDRKIHSGDSEIRMYEFFAKLLSGCLRKILRIVIPLLRLQVLMKCITDILLLQMDGG